MGLPNGKALKVELLIHQLGMGRTPYDKFHHDPGGLWQCSAAVLVTFLSLIMVSGDKDMYGPIER